MAIHQSLTSCHPSVQVFHSQSLRERPLAVWILLERNGDVVTAHSSCMAGVGEVCSHVAAVLFYLEVAVRSRDSTSATDKENRWLAPKRESASKGLIAKLDFSSAKKKKEDLDQACASGLGSTPLYDTLRPSKADNPVLQAEKRSKFLDRLSNSSARPVVLSLLKPYCNSYIPELSRYPGVVPKNFYDPVSRDKGLTDLIRECSSLADSLELSKRAQSLIEQQTRGQATSHKWFLYRQGRVTASVFYDVCHAGIEKPPMSLLKKLCMANKPINAPGIKWGRSQEKNARASYQLRAMCLHEDAKFQDSGLIVSVRDPFVGATPDGLVSCSCCGAGVYELKCPLTAADLTFEDALQLPSFCLGNTDSGVQLKHRHRYFYQVQLQMHCSERLYADLAVWTPKWLFVERINYDPSFVVEELDRARTFYTRVVVPELVLTPQSALRKCCSFAGACASTKSAAAGVLLV